MACPDHLRCLKPATVSLHEFGQSDAMANEEIILNRLEDYLWEIPRQGGMRVPGRIYASEKLMAGLKTDNSLRQVMNVAHLPGIVGYSLAMPDIHWGYGFPIGGVAAVSVDDGVISPGGVGYDINCGVRLVKTGLVFEQIKDKLTRIVETLFSLIPSGVGSEGAIAKLSKQEEKRLLREGARWAVTEGYGHAEDLSHMEEGGRLATADPELISDRALERGLKQVGTLGSGNHFLEIGRVEEIYLPEAADTFGLFPDQVVILIHTGSRGLGYQTCEDSLKVMNKAMSNYGISLPDRQLACTPIQSPEGQDYLCSHGCRGELRLGQSTSDHEPGRKGFHESSQYQPQGAWLSVALRCLPQHCQDRRAYSRWEEAASVCASQRERRALLRRVIRKSRPTIRISANPFSSPETWDAIHICWSELRARWKKPSVAPATAPAE